MIEIGLKLYKPNFGENAFEYYFYFENELNTHLYYFVLTICIKKMPGVTSIAMKSIRTTILTL